MRYSLESENGDAMKKLTKRQKRLLWKLVRVIDGRVTWLWFAGGAENVILFKLQRRGYIWFGGGIAPHGVSMVTYWPTDKGCKAIGIQPLDRSPRR